MVVYLLYNVTIKTHFSVTGVSVWVSVLGITAYSWCICHLARKLYCKVFFFLPLHRTPLLRNFGYGGNQVTHRRGLSVSNPSTSCHSRTAEWKMPKKNPTQQSVEAFLWIDGTLAAEADAGGLTYDSQSSEILVARIPIFRLRFVVRHIWLLLFWHYAETSGICF